MKPYYTKKGSYKDGRNKIAVEQDGIVALFLPKPEVMVKLLEDLRVNNPDILLRVKREVKFSSNYVKKTTVKSRKQSVP